MEAALIIGIIAVIFAGITALNNSLHLKDRWRSRKTNRETGKNEPLLEQETEKIEKNVEAYRNIKIGNPESVSDGNATYITISLVDPFGGEYVADIDKGVSSERLIRGFLEALALPGTPDEYELVLDGLELDEGSIIRIVKRMENRVIPLKNVRKKA